MKKGPPELALDYRGVTHAIESTQIAYVRFVRCDVYDSRLNRTGIVGHKPAPYITCLRRAVIP